MACEGDFRILHLRQQFFRAIRHLLAIGAERYELIEYLLLTHALYLVPFQEDRVCLEELSYQGREIRLVFYNREYYVRVRYKHERLLLCLFELIKRLIFVECKLSLSLQLHDKVVAGHQEKPKEPILEL